jgi:UPF0755 protein
VKTDPRPGSAGTRERGGEHGGAPDWRPDPWDDPELVSGYEHAPVRRNRRWVGWMLLTLTVLVVTGALGGAWYGYWVLRQINPPGDAGDAVTFTINEGDDFDDVTTRLLEQGFITDEGVWRWYVERDRELEIIPGYYRVRPRDSMGNILRVLRTPPEETFTRVTFPEGLTVRQMADRLQDTVVQLRADRFVDGATDGSMGSGLAAPGVTSLEGLLFPDTYQVSNSETEKDVIRRMARLMERVWRQENASNQVADLGFTPYQVLIVASLIEEEAKLDEDRYKIARVIYNRLFLGMPLQIDAALRYGQDPDASITQLKLIDTPYNTYLHTGLPPTPITNPGRASIRAALNPVQNPPPGEAICRELAAQDRDAACLYLYYVLADEEGRHVFAATLEQHERNVAKAAAAGLLG